MSINNIPTKRFSVKRDSSTPDNVEKESVRKVMKTDVGSGSPQYFHDLHVCEHSTPTHNREYGFEVGGSPELNYRCSPIPMPCTQDGGNEVDWDWQSSTSKNSYDNVKSQTNSVETPKRTKQLQTKRNSNSPLLQKPLKRKQVRVENVENIGKLTAELKALSEKMEVIQRNCEVINRDEKEAQYEIQNKLKLECDKDNNEDTITEVVFNSINCKTEYEDLFDDSIDDFMIKCSQEIEEKFNLCKDKRNDVMESFIAHKESESSVSCKAQSDYVIVCSKSTETLTPSDILNYTSGNLNSQLKTYSNCSIKTNLVFHASQASVKCSNKNVTSVSCVKTTQQDKSTIQFPDDSFDDCLASCLDNDKLMSKWSEYDFSAINSSDNINCHRRTTKCAAVNATNNKIISGNFHSKEVSCSDTLNKYNSKIIADEVESRIVNENDKEKTQQLYNGKNTFENRKFFKTKSLSDQSFHRCKSSIASLEKQSASNGVYPSVSTSIFNVKDRNLCKSNNVPLNACMENAHTLNRKVGKEAGNYVVKYKSTGSLCNGKTTKQSSAVQCTPEEIERKRLEAKMKLEAKRKLQQTCTRTAETFIQTLVEKPTRR